MNSGTRNVCAQIELAALAVNSLLGDDVAMRQLGMQAFSADLIYVCAQGRYVRQKSQMQKYDLRNRACTQVENPRKIHCAESFLFVEKLAQKTFSIRAISVTSSATLVLLLLF